MGFVPPPPPVRINVDRNGLPLDYATYVWLLYGKRVEDKSPRRLAMEPRPPSRPDPGRRVTR